MTACISHRWNFCPSPAPPPHQSVCLTPGAFVLNQTGIVPMVDLVINHMAGGWGGGGRYNYDYYHNTFEKSDAAGNNSSNYFNTAGSFAPFQVDLGYGTDSGDINHRHPYMRQGLKTWGAWLSAKVGYRAYRWDVAYHIDPWFISDAGRVSP
jgi:hypothetical protein